MTSLHVICGLPPPIKNSGYASGYLAPATLTCDVIGRLYVALFFGIELVVLVMTRVGAKIGL